MTVLPMSPRCGSRAENSPMMRSWLRFKHGKNLGPRRYRYLHLGSERSRRYAGATKIQLRVPKQDQLEVKRRAPLAVVDTSPRQPCILSKTQKSPANFLITEIHGLQQATVVTILLFQMEMDMPGRTCECQ